MSWSPSSWSSFSGLTWSHRPRYPLLGLQCHSSWVVHDIHNLELFIASTTLSCSLHQKPWVVHCIHNPELFITSTVLSCSFHYNPELFIIFRHPWVFDLEFVYDILSFERLLGIQCPHPWLVHYAIALSCSLHHSSVLFISYSLAMCTLSSQLCTLRSFPHFVTLWGKEQIGRAHVWTPVTL